MFKSLLLVAALTPHLLAEQLAPPAPVSAGTSAVVSSRIAWWQQARFGMFLHWGLYSIPAQGEWHVFLEQVDYRDYRGLMDQFTAERYDPAAWAAAAKDAGMGYVVLTARHHDGFALWDSPASYQQFDSRHSAAKRDFIKDYTTAVRDAGLKVGLYYSPLDWRFPGYFFPGMYRENAEALRDQTYGQVEELLSGYGAIDLMWWDGGGDEWLGLGGLEFDFATSWHQRPKDKPFRGKPLWDAPRLAALVRRLQPEIVMNDRSGAPGDFISREHKVGDFNRDQPWEKCSTINGSWGYSPSPARPLYDILFELTHTVCRDGNFLLNIGPRADGSLDPGHQARLHEIGDWMRINGEAIHGTRGGPLLPTEHYGTTQAGDTVWVHLWYWPTDGRVTLGALPRGLVSGQGMSGDAVLVKEVGGQVVIERTSRSNQPVMTMVKLHLKP